MTTRLHCKRRRLLLRNNKPKQKNFASRQYHMDSLLFCQLKMLLNEFEFEYLRSSTEKEPSTIITDYSSFQQYVVDRILAGDLHSLHRMSLYFQALPAESPVPCDKLNTAPK